MVRDAAGEVGVTGGTPMLRVFFLLSVKHTHKLYSALIRPAESYV